MASALGVEFEGASGSFIPVGGTLREVEKITGRLPPELCGVDIITMCDIDNPLFGEKGAAHIFAPQKGADAEAVRLLDEGLVHISRIMKRDLGVDVSDIPGGGAAGGMGAGMAAFLGSRLQPGIETVLDTVGFDRSLEGADLVFTGEGSSTAVAARQGGNRRPAAPSSTGAGSRGGRRL